METDSQLGVRGNEGGMQEKEGKRTRRRNTVADLLITQRLFEVTLQTVYTTIACRIGLQK